MHPTIPSIQLPQDPILPNNETSLYCTIERVKPETATVHWVLAGIIYNGTTVSTPDNTEAYKLVNTWTHIFRRNDHNQQVKCVVTPEAGQGTSQTGNATLDVYHVYCKYYERGTIKHEMISLMYTMMYTIHIMIGEQSNTKCYP